jgi:beta-alanine--pyruvate transaminase
MSKRLINPKDLKAFWMPFTANRQFKQSPRMFVGAKDMHYTTDDGRQVLDATAGLWCVNAGHCRPLITEAIQKQAAELDYAPAFQMGHPKAFELANRLVELSPDGMDHGMLDFESVRSTSIVIMLHCLIHEICFRFQSRTRGSHVH